MTAAKTYLCMDKIHLSENVVSFEVYYIVKLFLLQGRHGSESSSDENTQGYGQEQDKGKKSRMMVGNLIAATN